MGILLELCFSGLSLAFEFEFLLWEFIDVRGEYIHHHPF